MCASAHAISASVVRQTGIHFGVAHMKRARLVALAAVVLLTLGVIAVALRPSGPPVDVSHPTLQLADGTRLAATVVMPRERTGPIPAVVIQTRYWRAFGLRVPDNPSAVPPMPREPITERLVAAGVGVVLVDVRGTGASEGQWTAPFARREALDAAEVIHWVATQPWCDGSVGTTGISYEGTTALLSAATAGPELKVVVAREIEWNVLEELLAPGGVRNVSFIEAWNASTQALDRNEYPALFPASARFIVKGVHPTDDDPRGEALAKRVSARVVTDVAAQVRSVRASTDTLGPDGPTIASLGPSAWADALSKSSASIRIYGGFWDAATADAVLNLVQALPQADGIIGPWSHEGTEAMSPFGDTSQATLNLDDVVEHLVSGLKNHSAKSKPLRRWYVAGAGRWSQADAWPAPPQEPLLLVQGGRLVTSGQPEFSSALDLNAHATSGTRNRWTAGLLQPVEFPDRRAAPGLVSWTATPAAEPMARFGRPVFECNATPHHQEAAVHAYLEAQLPSGEVRLVTEGVTRVSQAGPIVVQLRAVAFELPAGAALRLSVAASDEGTFERVPAEGPGGFTLTGTGEHPCRLRWVP